MNRRSSRHLFWLFIIGTILSLVIFDSVARFYISYMDSTAEAEKRARESNEIVIRDIESIASLVEIALSHIQSELLRAPVVPNAQLLQYKLQSWSPLWEEVPYMHSVLVIDPNHKVMMGGESWSDPSLQQPLENFLKQAMDLDKRNFFISEQMVLPNEEDYVVLMGRRLLDHDNHVVAILVAAIRLEYLFTNYVGMSGMQTGYQMICSPEGTPLWSYPLNPNLEGDVAEKMEKSRDGLLLESRSHSYSHLFLVKNLMSPEQVYEGFYKDLRKHTVVLSLVFPVVFILGILLYRRMKLSEELNISLKEKMAEIEQQALALRKGEEQFRSLLHAVKDGILAFDKNGKILFSNQGAKDVVFQATEEEMARRSLFGFMANEETVTHLRNDLDCYPNVAEIEDVLMGKRANGEAFPMEYSLGLLDGSDNPLFVGVFRDISSREVTLQQLRLLSKAVETISQGILVTSGEDEDYPILYANRAFLRMTGYRLEEVMGRNPRFLQGNRTDRMMVSLLRTALRNSEPISLELVNYRKSGHAFYNQLSIAPIRDDKGRVTHYVGVTHDVSQMNDLREQFLLSQKMEAIGKLAGGVAHDFNNLLTVINGYAQLGMSEAEKVSVTQYFQGILDASEHASTLTRQLLTISKRQNLQTQKLDFNRLVEGMRSMLQRLMGKQYQLLLELEPEPLIVEGDSGQLEQVILNLAINARDAMPDGGVLLLKTFSFSEAHPVKDGISIPGSLPVGDYVCLLCRDNGVGMDEATRQRVFEPFFTTKPAAEHNGLGLSTCFGIIQHSKGIIQVDSEPGKGTVFRIFLPWHRKAQVENTEVRQNIEINVLEGRRVLLVEDNQDVLRIAKLFLEGAGATVRAEVNGLQALRTLEADQGKPFDLLITDVLMPEMGGKELADAYLEMHPEGKVVFISGFTDEIFNWNRKSDERCTFLMKPFEKNQLFHAIHSILS